MVRVQWTMMRSRLLGALALAGSLLGPAAAAACDAFPANIQVDAFFAGVADEVLAASPTFAAQCDRIAAAPRMRVAVRLLPKLEEGEFRARTTVRRFTSGLVTALVEIPSPRTEIEYAELFGHEFEHVLEQ